MPVRWFRGWIRDLLLAGHQQRAYRDVLAACHVANTEISEIYNLASQHSPNPQNNYKTVFLQDKERHSGKYLF